MMCRTTVFGKIWLSASELISGKLKMAVTQNIQKARAHVRYESALLRERFDRNNKCTNEEQAKTLLIEGEKELKANLCLPRLEFANSYGALTHDRSIELPDYVLDYWHPLEKAQYPDYFARREERKKEFIAMWNRTYSDAKPGSKKSTPPKQRCK